MKLSIQIILVLFLWLTLFSGTQNRFLDFGILTEEDMKIEEAQDTPAIHSPDGTTPYFESYNQWVCFKHAQIEYGCYDDDFRKKMEKDDEDGKGYIARLFLTFQNDSFEFEDAGYRTDLDQCLETLEQWKTNIENQDSFCAFAARMPLVNNASDTDEAVELDDGYFLLYGFKSLAGSQMAEVYKPTEEVADQDQDTQ